MIVKWNVDHVGEVRMNVSDDRLMRLLNALSLLDIPASVEME